MVFLAKGSSPAWPGAELGGLLGAVVVQSRPREHSQAGWGALGLGKPPLRIRCPPVAELSSGHRGLELPVWTVPVGAVENPWYQLDSDPASPDAPRPHAPEHVAASILAFFCPPKLHKKTGRQRQEHSRLPPPELCPCLHEEPRGSYSWGRVCGWRMNRGVRILRASPHAFSKTIIRLAWVAPGNLGLVVCWPSRWVRCSFLDCSETFFYNAEERKT